MRFMAMIKSDANTEGGVMPTQEELDAMGRYNEELAKAGVMLAGEGLHPSSRGARVKFNDGKPTVVDGPFTEAKELIAGFWLLDVKSKAEAIEWVKRVPCTEGVEFEIEIRQVFEADDFGAAYTDEMRERDEHLRIRERQNSADKQG
ncbi:MAG: YciI family protein [Pseudonocardiaceae bacterium]|nr:YciI family protein [Pseudonocardiaceae bacterium]